MAALLCPELRNSRNNNRTCERSRSFLFLLMQPAGTCRGEWCREVLVHACLEGLLYMHPAGLCMNRLSAYSRLGALLATGGAGRLPATPSVAAQHGALAP